MTTGDPKLNFLQVDENCLYPDGSLKIYAQDTSRSSGNVTIKMSDTTPKEMVNHPKHYNEHKWEVIEILQEFFKDDPLIWQTAKYIFRYKHKEDPIQDLKKAKWYLEYKINELEQSKQKASN